MEARGSGVDATMRDHMGTIRGVSFDAGNTLIRVRGSVGAIYAAVAGRHGFDVGEEELQAAFREAFAARRNGFVQGTSEPHSGERERLWWRGLVEEVFASLGLPGRRGSRFEDFFEELYHAFERPEHWEVFADVGPCLDALDARGVPAGVVSNWDSRLRVTLEGLGIRERFRFVLTSAEFGAEKPDPSIFLEAVRRLELEPGQVLHVGDLVEDDLRGARNAGLQGVVIDRGSGNSHGNPCIQSLGEILHMIT
jgi:putative hydrolase of the HAD superfamily